MITMAAELHTSPEQLEDRRKQLESQVNVLAMSDADGYERLMQCCQLNGEASQRLLGQLPAKFTVRRWGTDKEPYYVLREGLREVVLSRKRRR